MLTSLILIEKEGDLSLTQRNDVWPPANQIYLNLVTSCIGQVVLLDGVEAVPIHGNCVQPYLSYCLQIISRNLDARYYRYFNLAF